MFFVLILIEKYSVIKNTDIFYTNTTLSNIDQYPYDCMSILELVTSRKITNRQKIFSNKKNISIG